MKKQAAILGGRIGFTFLAVFVFFIFVTYLVLSQNFKNLLTDYSIKLVQALADQGVTMIEYELRVSKDETNVLADSFLPPTSKEQSITFPTTFSKSDVLRLVYVSEDGSAASDGRQLDLSSREDIIKAYRGETAVYGPYFNEENEYVICYSAPVFRNGKIVGVLSIEKDGYYFCNLIKDIRFSNSGESYIINAEGTDIAVSDLEHIDWVKEQYNARHILEERKDAETLSIMELEQKGLSGERGVGTYYWNDSLCYIVYVPVPSVQWVLLAGMRQEEINVMIQSLLFSSITNGSVLSIIIIIFLLLTSLIIFWILSSMKESVKINEKLNVIANYDPLTGVMNRNSYNTAADTLSTEKNHSLACIYIDVNGLHEINNHLGHQAGDKMLKIVADVLGHIFSQDNIYRIGGDEFVVFCKNLSRQEVINKMSTVRQDLRVQGYEISIGIEWQDENYNINTVVKKAEEAMRKDKQRYYQENGKERQIRALDEELEQMVLEKQDADTFLSVLAPEFKGVYFVDLGLDTIRHLYIPSYFEEMLKECNDVFSKALYLYNHQVVISKYQEQFEKFCDYHYIEMQLNNSASLEFTYQKIDGSWLKLRILKFKTYTNTCRETLWIFSNIN